MSAQNENEKQLYDVVIIGGGPAGLTAALYLARARYRVIVVEKERFGGQITITSEVVNYPGVMKTSGAELTDTMRRQAQSFGAEFLLAKVQSLETEGDIKTVRTDRGSLNCFGILAATGAHPRSVGFAGEEEFKGHGVAYCATCDGEFFSGKEVFVIGGGFAAAEESVFLTKYASHVTILMRGEDFTCAEAVAETARNHGKITVLNHVSVESVSGQESLQVLRYRNLKTGEVTERRALEQDSFGVFVFAGYEPATALLQGIAQLDGSGYVITDSRQRTSAEGIYAAGDVCAKSLRQVVTAVGDGAIAATELEKYAAAMQEKTGRRPAFPQKRVQPDAGERTAAEVAAAAPEKAGEDSADGGLFTAEMKAQLDAVFARMEQPLVLKLYLDERPVSLELRQYMNALASLTQKLSVEIGDAKGAQENLPCVRIMRADGSDTGLAFHGVPGGHEFTSFVLGLYNAAGPGQAMEEELAAAVHSIAKKVDMKVLVSLSCTMCPELVTAAQKLAAENEEISAEVYDLNHFPNLKEQYRVMSVPCLVINDSQVSFGKKNIRQLLELLTKL